MRTCISCSDKFSSIYMALTSNIFLSAIIIVLYEHRRGFWQFGRNVRLNKDGIF